MKQLFILVALFATFTSFAQTPKATFDKKGLEFRDIKEGDKLEFYYYFTNTGTADLILKGVHPTCGCTVAEWPKYSIAPGKRDSIFVSFDTEGRPGYNAKGVNIHSNAGEISLVFEAYVLPKPGTDPFKDEKENSTEE